MATKRKTTAGIEVISSPSSGDDVMKVMPIGAGNEVGRSCIVLKYKGKTIMLDCGIHPGNTGVGALPFFDLIDPAEVDLLLVTHFHLDHAASLPYFTEKTAGFKGRIFMTHPTKAVMKMLLQDYVKISNISTEDMLYTETDLKNCMDKCEQIDYHQELEVDGIKFTCYNAGHVLGAAMFMIEIADVKVLYTGDYSLEDDRHLMAAEVPSATPDVLMVEATYGVQLHEAREEREKRFTDAVAGIVRRGGSCLVPVWALGRAQELMLILDEYWEAHTELQNVPIYYASKLATKALNVYRTYINMMNKHIRDRVRADRANPFDFKHINYLKDIGSFDDTGSSVVMASPGMLQSGISRQLFDRWCTDARNGVVLPGYCVVGTLAHTILTEPDEVTAMDGRILPLNCSVDYVSFSAHADFVQTNGFVNSVDPAHIILVHGEANEMKRLHDALKKNYRDKQLYMPANGEEVELTFRAVRSAKVIGRLAKRHQQEAEWRTARQQQVQGQGRGRRKAAGEAGGEEEEEEEERDVAAESRADAPRVSGVVVRRSFALTAVAPTELSTYSSLSSAAVEQTLHVPFRQTPAVLEHFLKQMFGFVEESVDSAGRAEWAVMSSHVSPPVRPCPSSSAASPAAPPPPPPPLLTLAPLVTLTLDTEARQVVLRWCATAAADMVADAVSALVLQAGCCPAAVRLTSKPCAHSAPPTATPAQTTTRPSQDTTAATGTTASASGCCAGGGAHDNAHVAVVQATLTEQFGAVSRVVGADDSSTDGKGMSSGGGHVSLAVDVGGCVATVDCSTYTVRCDNDAVRRRVAKALAPVVNTMRPLRV